MDVVNFLLLHGIMRLVNRCMLLPKALKMRTIEDAMASSAALLQSNSRSDKDPGAESFRILYLAEGLLGLQGHKGLQPEKMQPDDASTNRCITI